MMELWEEHTYFKWHLKLLLLSHIGLMGLDYLADKKLLSQDASLLFRHTAFMFSQRHCPSTYVFIYLIKIYL